MLKSPMRVKLSDTKKSACRLYAFVHVSDHPPFANPASHMSDTETSEPIPHFDSLERIVLDVEQGQPILLKLSVACSEPMSFQWFSGTLNMPRETPVEGQNHAELILLTDASTQSAHYRCKVTSPACPEGRLSRWFFVKMKKTPTASTPDPTPTHSRRVLRPKRYR